jgi:hypothetical protein
MKRYPTVGACGLACGLCPRYYTKGVFRCPGCDGEGFAVNHPACGFVTCAVKRHGLETCGECPDSGGCERLARLLESARVKDSFISYRCVEDNLCSIRERGIADFARQVDERQVVLRRLTSGFDDGRSRSFYCIACQLLPLASLNLTLATADEDTNVPVKERARTMRTLLSELAERAGVDLELRK